MEIDEYSFQNERICISVKQFRENIQMGMIPYEKESSF